MKSILSSFRWIRDLFWPLPEPPASNERQKEEMALAAEIAALPTGECDLTEHLKILTSLLDQEKERRQSVETRLTTIMGLASIAGTIVFGTILAQITGTLHVPPGIRRLSIALGSLYLVLQVCSAIFAAVCGVSVRAYLALTSADFLIEGSETKPIHLRNLATKHLKHLADHQFHNNKKVTWMAAAHKAMRQFLFGLLIFALMSTYFAITVPVAHDDLVETLKKNHELQELLRGPAGPPGPVGPKGESGKIGGNNPNH